MFNITDKDTVWVFTTHRDRIIGQVSNFLVDTIGHPIMLEITTGASVSTARTIPWVSICYIEKLANQ
ncbi:MAG: hypothetical protein ABWY25_07470 [Paenisporosarcina sp.]